MKNFTTALVFLLMFGKFSSAQSFNCYITNDHLVSSTVYEFDVYIQSTSSDFSFRTMQGCFSFSPAFIPSGAAITASFVEGSSKLINYHPQRLTWSAAGNAFEVPANINVNCSSGSVITASSPSLVGTFRLTITNAHSFNCAPANPNMVLANDNSPKGLHLKMAITRWSTLNCSVGSNLTITKLGTFTQFDPNTLYDKVNNMRPSIVAQPVAATSCPDGSAIFTVNANGNNGVSDALNYQWYENGIPVSDGVKSNGTYTGAVTSRLMINNTSSYLNGNNYLCLVSQCNNKTSESALLTIGNESSPISLGGDVMLFSGSTVTLDAGSGFTSYSWSTNANTQTIVVQSPGTYTVSATSPNSNCPSTDKVQVTLFNGKINADGANDISLYPNPVANDLNISTGNNLFKEVKIYNSLGQKQKGTYSLVKNGATLEINVASLTSGIYYIELLTSDNSYVRKFVKE